MLLETKSLTKYFGGLAAVSEVDMAIDEGQIVGLIGPNGAGKTTFFNLITGFLRPSKGEINFEGRDISHKKPYSIAKMGIGRTFQLATSFSDFSVLENVVASFHLYAKPNLWEAIFRTSTYHRKEEYILNQAMETLRITGLTKVKNELAKNLPHGYQKMLTMARALAINPKLLLLDEPLSGMNPGEIGTAMEVIEKARQEGVTILLVEHNLKIMDICNKMIVLNYGCKIAEGSPGEVRENREVIAAYLGGELDA